MVTIDVLLAGMSVGTDQGRLGLATISLVRGRRNILIDVGHYGRREILQQALFDHGLTPSDIHMVVLTHGHWDHAQNVDIFPNATFLIHPAELDYCRSPRKGDWATPGYFVATLQGLKVEEVVEGVELEPGVKIIETPGHSRGHISVLVDTHDGTAIIAGDAFPDAAVVNRGKPYLIFWDELEAANSVKKIMNLSNVIYPGHDRPFRINEDRSVEYMDGVASLKVMIGFEQGNKGVAVTIADTTIRHPWSHPDARA